MPIAHADPRVASCAPRVSCASHGDAHDETSTWTAGGGRRRSRHIDGNVPAASRRHRHMKSCTSSRFAFLSGNAVTTMPFC
ncbi:hypothetical protein OIV56_32130, partial [Burkholderia pseudomallei]|uniref:hypothetical protein n=1 Tax=Burkholderia pseudomallei TaxID=28450 RepID=UPI0021F761B5